MANSYVPYGPDPTTPGRRQATIKATETRDGVTGEFHYDPIISIDERVRSGVHLGQTGLHAISATAHAATAGFWFLLNPVGSGILMALRRVEFQSNTTAVTAMLTLPRLQVESFTFTGTHTGALVATRKQRSTMPNPVGRLSLVSTGATITAGVPMYAFLPVVILTGVAGLPPSTADWNPEGAGQPILAPGEGFMFRQPDAATASDTRRFVTNIAWEEFVDLA